MTLMEAPPDFSGKSEVRFWRIDKRAHAQDWHSGEGSHRYGGRWNRRGGTHTVYLSLNPGTALIEQIVNMGVDRVDSTPLVITSARLILPVDDFVTIKPDDLPNSMWLTDSGVNERAQRWGEECMNEHGFVVIPSAAFPYSWNLIVDAGTLAGRYDDVRREPLRSDPRICRDDSEDEG